MKVNTSIKSRISFLSAVIFTVFALNPIACFASPITFYFSGNIYDVSPSVAGTFAVGQSINGSYTFESTSVGESFSPGGVLDPSITYYPSALKSFDIDFGSYASSLGSLNRIFVINDSTEGLNNGILKMDRYIVDTFFNAGATVSGLSPYSLFLNFQDNSGTLINDGALPLTPSILSQFLPASGALDFVDGRANNRATFTISSISLSPVSVPEPNTYWLLVIGLVGLLFYRHAHRSRRRLKYSFR